VAGQPTDHLKSGEEPGGQLARRVGDRVRERRQALGRTLADVAGEADISVSYLSAIEHGTNMPSLPVLGRLVHALRLTLHELLQFEERQHVRTGDVAGEQPGTQPLHHPGLRLHVSSLVARPGDRGEAPMPTVGTMVFVFVERGALVIEVDGTSHALGQGDALDAIDVAEMRWESLGEVPSLSLWAVAPATATGPTR
jgi:transcriptional regulator with XRE-family HTH domain